MNNFTLLYFVYIAKLGSQASIYFIWLFDSSSPTIAPIAGVVAIFDIVPFIHIIVHIFSAKPLSSPTFIAYLCFSGLFAILWYESTQGGRHRVLSFATVTTFDLLALLFFLFQRQISRWHHTLTSDIEQGDTTSATLVGRRDEQSEHRDFGARPNIPRTHQPQVMQPYDIHPMNRFRGRSIHAGSIQLNPHDGRRSGPEMGARGFADDEVRDDRDSWASGMVQPFGGQEVEEDPADRQLDQSPRRSSFIHMGVDIGTSSGDIHLPHTAISGHPAFRPADSTSRPISHGGFETPKEAPNLLPGGNQF